jgi:hypothetical protein
VTSTGKLSCSCDGCEKPPKAKGLCLMHYTRQHRYGTLEKVRTRKKTYIHTHGYIVEHSPEHPLANGSGEVFQHRRVYFDRYGAGPFACEGCGIEIVWKTLHIDHLDDCRSNNRLSNLSPKCPLCNVKRGFPKGNKTRALMYEIEYQGRKCRIVDLAEMIDMTANGLRRRLKTMSIEEAMTKPKYRILKRNHDKCSRARQQEHVKPREKE